MPDETCASRRRLGARLAGRRSWRPSRAMAPAVGGVGAGAEPAGGRVDAGRRAGDHGAGLVEVGAAWRRRWPGLLIGAIATGVGHFGSNYSASSAGRKWLLGGMGAAILSGLAWTIATTLYSATGG